MKSRLVAGRDGERTGGGGGLSLIDIASVKRLAIEAPIQRGNGRNRADQVAGASRRLDRPDHRTGKVAAIGSDFVNGPETAIGTAAVTGSTRASGEVLGRAGKIVRMGTGGQDGPPDHLAKELP